MRTNSKRERNKKRGRHNTSQELMEHLTTDFGSLGLTSSRGGGGASGSNAGEWPRQQPVPLPHPRNTPPQSQQFPRSSSRGSTNSNGNNHMMPSVNRSSSHDWQQLESDLNAATAKEFVPGHGWNTNHSSASSVGSNSQGEFCDLRHS